MKPKVVIALANKVRRAMVKRSGVTISAAEFRELADAGGMAWIDALEQRAKIDALSELPDLSPYLSGRVTIYFIRSASGLIKIGRTNNLVRRLVQLQSGSPEPLECVATLQAHPQAETALHYHFRPERMTGEWFYASVRLSRFIDSLRNGEE